VVFGEWRPKVELHGLDGVLETEREWDNAFGVVFGDGRADDKLGAGFVEEVEVVGGEFDGFADAEAGVEHK